MHASKHRSRKYTMASNKKPPYLLLLLLAIGAAMLSVGILHKSREHRVFSILLQERNQELISLQVLLEKEKETNKEMRRKLDDLEAKTSVLSIERTELKNKLMDSETTTTYLTNTQKELEAALAKKEGHINEMKESASDSEPVQMATIKEVLQQKEAELEEIKTESVGTNSEDTTPDTVVLENSAKPGDSIPAPAEEHHSDDKTASESNQQDESTNNENATSGTVVLGDSIPAPAEENHSYNNTASESNQQDESTNSENATSDTVVPENSANSGDSIPAPVEEHHANNNTASESNQQDGSIGVSENNGNATPEAVVLDRYANSSDPTPTSAEELHSDNSTASESNHQEDGSSEHFIKLTTNMEDDGLQERAAGDANERSDNAPEASHSENSELPQWSPKLADNQNNTEELDGTRQLEDTQGEESRGSKLLEQEASKEVEPQKEIRPEGELEISKDTLSEASQNRMQAVEPVADPADVKPSMSINNDETKETSKRHRRRKYRSKRKKRTNVADSNVDGESIKQR